MAKDWTNIGKVMTLVENENSLIYNCEEGKVRVSIQDSGAVRVQAVRNGVGFEKVSYALDSDERTQPIKYIHKDQTDLIEWEVFNIKVYYDPFRIDFITKDGELILEDDSSLSIGWDGDEVTNYKKLGEQERFIGLGEKTHHLDKRGLQFVNWNTDFFGYQAESDPIYASFPFYIGIREQRPYGVFLNNSSKTTFNFGCSNDRFSFFRADKGHLDYFFMFTGDIGGVLTQYTQLTGRHELPPIWSLGFQQCRYSYYPDKEVLRIASTFREKGIPADVIYLDIHYMQDYKVFTWNEKTFSKPKELLAALEAEGFKVVVILDPGIKVEKGYEPYDSALDQNLFVEYPDGQLYRGEVWPGWCHFPDFTNEAARTWWAERVAVLREQGIRGFWNDMNEPAAWGQKIPDLIQFKFEGQGASHKEARNVYGMQMTRATNQGAKLARPDERPFVLTRAGFSGSQRYCAIWTGDNCSSSDHLMLGSRLVSNLGMAGMAFAGNDVGGFIGESSVDLFIRWIQVGAFSPLFRMHTMINSKPNEPWSYGEEATEIATNYINFRYRLISYLYSHFFRYTCNGMPIIQSLAIKHWMEGQVFDHRYDAQFFCGDTLLICPVVPGDSFQKVYLPSGGWYDIHSDTYFEGSNEVLLELNKERLPIFARAGNLLVLNRTGSNTGAIDYSELELHIYYSKNEGELYIHYEDDGISYKNKDGHYYQREIIYSAGRVNFGQVTGSYAILNRRWKLYFHGFARVPEQCIRETYQFLTPVSNFDPFVKGSDPSGRIDSLPYLEINDCIEAFSIEIIN